MLGSGHQMRSSLHTSHTQKCRAGPQGRHRAWQVLVTNTATSQVAKVGKGWHVLIILFPLVLIAFSHISRIGDTERKPYS